MHREKITLDISGFAIYLKCADSQERLVFGELSEMAERGGLENRWSPK